MFAFAFTFSVKSFAVTNNWIGGNQATANWSTAGNWSGGIPINTSDITFPTGVTVTFTTIPAGAVAQSIIINGTGSVTFNGGNSAQLAMEALFQELLFQLAVPLYHFPVVHF